MAARQVAWRPVPRGMEGTDQDVEGGLDVVPKGLRLGISAVDQPLGEALLDFADAADLSAWLAMPCGCGSLQTP